MASKIKEKQQGAMLPGARTPKGPNKKSEHTITMKPGEQMRVDLGVCEPSGRARGFSIDLDPDPFPENSVETQIINTGTAKNEKMVLFIANYGTRPVTAVVRQL